MDIRLTFSYSERTIQNKKDSPTCEYPRHLCADGAKDGVFMYVDVQRQPAQPQVQNTDEKRIVGTKSDKDVDPSNTVGVRGSVRCQNQVMFDTIIVIGYYGTKRQQLEYHYVLP